MWIWYVTVGLVLSGLVIDSFMVLARRRRKAAGHRSRRRFITMGKERDMFFIPGDSLHTDRDDDFDE